ncbi:MAG TPA: hypothetical protein VF337_04690 [Candidatus Limnocylindrales bacterium]
MPVVYRVPTRRVNSHMHENRKGVDVAHLTHRMGRLGGLARTDTLAIIPGSLALASILGVVLAPRSGLPAMAMVFEVGEGPGWTWRPSRIDFLPFGLLRIDLQLSAGRIRPVSTSIDCGVPGDHCRLSGDYEVD